MNAHEPDKMKKVKISKLYEFDGLNKVEVKEANVGAIVAISGISDIHIGDTICSSNKPCCHSIPKNIRTYNFNEFRSK